MNDVAEIAGADAEALVPVVGLEVELGGVLLLLEHAATTITAADPSTAVTLFLVTDLK